ncbi:ABC-F family ATP-binding cassette domain-containing protein [Cerasicoccus arenae]|uniref:ABC transporter ATP-binding protein n=1 Tax=Cerasicoccus arenae TaxID=424488 RepID=A0A8J3GD91_9BACT|nr:ABC-F family ATP-binding cassette domain-containing protein [Cerasicoccus arenae]MBK1856795.1 ABC-F family ATP-binding cassette domain-containing protein [Cerasicoccus arenae]GHB99553.1 ABC transporter ATP-binding protein [Cerasicoccus arenae]
MIVINDLSLAYGEKAIFSEINATIGPRDRIALIGVNGSGKSTLIKVLLGLAEYDSGAIEKHSYVTLGYLPQDGIEARGKTLFEEVETAFADILQLQEKIDAASEQMYELDTDDPAYYELIDTIGEWEQQLEDAEPAKIKSQIERILQGLGFSMSDMGRQTEEFSGGWQMRIALAKLLLKKPSLLLLDEPTNHLDIISQNWLEKYLQGYHGSLMVISHDKAFLNAVTNATYELKFGNLNTYSGNYSFYLKESAARLATQRKKADNQSKDIARQKEFINRFRANQKKASMVQSRIKQLDKIERVEVDREERKIYFRFPEPPPASQKVVEIKDIYKSYGDIQVFKGLSLRIDRGDRIAVVGVNGAGKSTLARILAGVEPVDSGEIDKGVNTVIGYFAQQQAEELNPNNTVQEEAESAVDGNPNANPRAALGALLFSGQAQQKSISVLSGGERNRVALAKMLMRPANCIILDEPTNHLDLRSKEVLQEAITLFSGTMLIVSHDRDFLDPVVNKVLEISPSGSRLLTCNVSEYIARIEEEAAGA